MATKILCVDDEPNVLEALERLLSDSFDVMTTSDPHEALALIAKEPFAVVMSDMRMPLMSGADLLTRARNAAPQTVRILLTGQADLATAAAAVNEGAVFRFLVKPCPADALSAALDAALEQHCLLIAERELLDRTLTSMVKLLTDVLAVGSPGIFQRTGRIQRYVVHMAKALSLPNAWQYEVAASLSQLGCMALPDELITKVVAGARLTTAERASLYASGDRASVARRDDRRSAASHRHGVRRADREWAGARPSHGLAHDVVEPRGPPLRRHARRRG